MDSIASILKRKLKGNPASTSSITLKNTIYHLEQLESSSADIMDDNVQVWDTIRNDFKTLYAEGICDKDELEENMRLLDDLRMPATDPAKGGLPPHPTEPMENGRISIIQLPSGHLPSTLSNVFAQSLATLPLELVDTFNHTYLLHVLATNPEKILPPGKSILSMMSGPHTQSEHGEESLPKLQVKVEGLAQQAFWDVVRRLHHRISDLI
jgi:hypothetical protein